MPIRSLHIIYIALACLALTVFTSCRGDDELLVPSTEVSAPAGGKSFFLLNEGNMGSNKASLDFYDGHAGTYRRNIFPEQNPSVAFELGDVGNDLAVYGSKLYAVVNASGLIEVMEAKTARHLGQISLPNCRYICFAAGKAYVSSYAGPLSLDAKDSRPGLVARIDTATLMVEATCTVGFQPEQMCIVSNRLFVANSGGYQPPDYDNRVSVIDLDAFSVVHEIEVAPNLHVMKLHDGQLFVGSRGDYADTPSDIYLLNPQTMAVEGTFGVEADVFDFYENKLIAVRGGMQKRITVYDLSTHTSRDFITDGTLPDIQMPYGLAVDEAAQRIYITDARDYVSPGRLLCYGIDGRRQWAVTTGDIPAHFAFYADARIDDSPSPHGEDPKGISQIYEYRPAPGQFVNLLPAYVSGDTEASMNAKVLEAIGQGRQGLVTLGAAGGYLVAGFAEPVPNISGEYDLEIQGNAFENASEPGVVSVMKDENGNGLPDDVWYELAGSAHSEARKGYVLTYTPPAANHEPVAGNEAWCADAQYIAWNDNEGASGWMAQNIYHRQPYFPQWLGASPLQFCLTLLPDLSYRSGDTWLQPAFGWGYADNLPNHTDGCKFKIDWAVDTEGQSVHLDAIDFIRVQTSVFRQMEAIGEASTEISRIRSLH